MGYYVEYKEEGTEAWVKVCDILKLLSRYDKLLS